MTDVVEDIITAFNQARFDVADDFDRMRASNMQFYRSHMQGWVDDVYRGYGDDGWGQFATYGAALVASSFDVLLDFVQGVGAATFIDPLRLGAGAEKGTAGGYAEDALRVVGVVGGALKLLKFGKYLRGASAVGGGVMSCTPTSAGKALTYARLAAVPTVEQMAQGTMNVAAAGQQAVHYGPTFVRTAGYSGAWISEVVPNLAKAGAAIEAKPVQSFEQVVGLVNQNKGPVLFSLEWRTAAGIPGGSHTMMAYRPFFGSGIRLADQFGNMHTIKTSRQGGQIIAQVVAGRGTTVKGLAGSRPLQAGDVIGVIHRVHGDAYVVRDTVLLDVAANLPLAQRLGVPLYEPIDDQFWHKVGYAASMAPSAPAKLRKVGDGVKETIAANPAGKPNGGGTTVNRPASSLPLTPRAKAVLALLGPPGSKTDWVSLRAKLDGAKIPSSDYYPALQELDGWGVAAIERFGSDSLNFVSVTRN